MLNIVNMRRQMFHIGAAAVLAIGAMTSTATPARASDDALFKFLLGAATVAIIVHSASRSQGQGRQTQNDPRALPAHCRETLSIRGRHVAAYNAACLRDARVRNLPQQCAQTIRTNRGQHQVYRAQCLERAGFRAAANTQRNQALPNACRITYTYRGTRHQGYSADCLRRQGVRNLPATCQVRSTQGAIYGASCLRDQGYRIR